MSTSFSFKSLSHTLSAHAATVAVCASLCGAFAVAATQPADPALDLAMQQQDVVQTAVAVHDFDVYVDLPTSFAFIKLPSGWKFIGKLDAEQMKHLPAGTLTALLRPDESMSPTRLASAASAMPMQK